MSPSASPGGYSGSGCCYPQTKVNQTPRFDNQVKKRKRKKKGGK